MNGVEFSNQLYALLVSPPNESDVPDSIIEMATRGTTVQMSLHLPLILVAFLERIAGRQFGDVIEEAVIQHVLGHEFGKEAFARFCSQYFQKQMEEIAHARTGGIAP